MSTVISTVRGPLIPVIVRVYVPVGVLVLVVTESVDDEIAGFGLKVPLAPLGNPATLKLTWPAKPRIGVTVAV